MRRRHHRITLRKAVQVVSSTDALQGHTVNLSESGMFLEADDVLPVGTAVALSLPEDEPRVRLEGRVVRTEPTSKMGIEFMDLSEPALGLLRSMVGGTESTVDDAKRTATVWYEGQSHPIKSQALFEDGALMVSTKLPFLRQSSTVEFQLEGEQTRRSGRLESVELSVDREERVPKLTICLAMPESAGASPGPAFLARSFEVYRGRGNNLEEALLDLTQARAAASSAPTEPPPEPEEEERDHGASDEGVDPFADLELALEEPTTSLAQLDQPREELLEPAPSRSMTTSVEVEEQLEEVEYFDGGSLADGLRHVDIGGTRLTERGLVHLRSLPSLQHIGLRGTRVTDEGLACLRRLPSLRHLDMSGTGIGDEGLELLCEQAALSGESVEALGPPAEDAPARQPWSGSRLWSVAMVVAAFALGVMVAMIGGIFRSGAEPAEAASPQRQPPQQTAPAQSEVEPVTSDPEPGDPPSPPSSGHVPAPAAAPEDPPPSMSDQRATVVPVRSEVVRVVTEGVGHVLIVPMAGSLDGLEEYQLVRPHGVAIDLPAAEPAVGLGDYLISEYGFGRLRISRGVGASEEGAHLRVHFARREDRYRVEAGAGAVRVILPR